MKNTYNTTKITLATIAIVFTILITRIVPHEQFSPYTLQLDSIWAKEDLQQEYWLDINNDGTIDKIRHHNINISGHSIEQRQKNKLNQIYIFKDGEKFIGKNLTFIDVIGDTAPELLFVSVKSNLTHLNILSLDPTTKILTPVKKIVIDSIQQHDGEPDAVNTFIVADGADLYFNLQGGYAVQPRNIYKYNIEQKTLIKTKLSSLVTPRAQLFYDKGKQYLLAKHVKSTGNTISYNEAEWLKNSTNKDTLEMYETVKHLKYTIGDFSSYILLYNNQLDFAFDPIEFYGWTNFTKTQIITIDSVQHIIALTNASINEPENERAKTVTLCNLQGKILKQTPLPYNYTDVFTNNKLIVFHGDKKLFLQNKQLETLNEISDIDYAYGFTNIDQDHQSEFLTFQNNKLTIFSDKFDINATFQIQQEYAPYPENNRITTLSINGKHLFLYNSRLFYYLFTYEKNNLAAFKYPFYLAVFLALFSILLGVYSMGTKRLEKENLRLEQKVIERTSEIAAQKKEIENQAEELKKSNKKLLELGQFKEGLTSMIVHDLKNPLNGIINISKSISPENQVLQMKQTGRQMLTLVQNILDVNKYEQTNMTIDKAQVPLFELSQKAISNVRFLAERKNISIENNIAQNPVVKADAEIIERVFINLFTNAIKYTPNNGNIYLNAEKPEDKQALIKISVTDTGLGIPANKLHLVFTKFGQVAAKKSGSVRSTGLGLTFCKMAIEAHDGEIEVQSEINKGTTFSFTLQADKNTKLGNIVSSQKDETLKKYQLSIAEKQILVPFVNQLQKIEIYKMFEIRKIVRSIDEKGSKNIKHWKQELMAAIENGNKEQYKKLITI